MPNKPPEPISKMLLYHITHWQNLIGIIEQQGIWCGSEIKKLEIGHKSAAHSHIQQRRLIKKVPVEPFGTLPNYVPWSFAYHQPMLCAIHHRQIKNQQVEQRDMVHLITSFARVKRANLTWVISDGHPTIITSKFFRKRI